MSDNRASASGSFQNIDQPQNNELGTSDSNNSIPTSATSHGSQMHLLVTMPASGAANAPLFAGPRARTFLETLRRLCDSAGPSENESVNQIYWFSTVQVQDTIRYVDELDLELENKTWEDARTKLLQLYGSLDQDPTVTLQDLQNFVTRQSEKPPFTDRLEVDHYHQIFLRYSGPLIRKKTITKAESYYYFISGLPSELKKWLETQMPQDKKKKTDTLTIGETLEHLYVRFDTSSVFYDTWKDNAASKTDRIRLDNEGERKPLKHTKIPIPESLNRNMGNPGGVPATSVDDLIKQMEALKINQAQVLSLLSANHKSTTTVNSPFPAFTSDLPRRCFMCGKEEPQLDHRLHISHCPETKSLVVEGLIKWDEGHRRYTLNDGNDLPRAPRNFIGGVAAYIRGTLNANRSGSVPSTSNNFRRDIPPHQAKANMIGLFINDEPALGHSVFDVSHLEHETYPAVRSSRDNNTRYDPRARPDGPSTRSKEKQHVDNPQPSSSNRPTPLTGPGMPGTNLRPQQQPTSQQLPKPKSMSIPIPPNPINRQDGWKESVPSRAKPDNSKDIKMKDETKNDKPMPTFHYTSDVQQRADPKAVYEQILNTVINVPLFQLIGNSPPLQKLFNESTKTRREYVAKTAESFYNLDSYDSSPIYSSSTVTSEPSDTHVDSVSMKVVARDGSTDIYKVDNLSVGDVSTMMDFLSRCSNSIMIDPDPKLFAMVTGLVDIHINGVSFTAMIDSGSELNVASVDLPDRAGLPVDFEGMNWSLKGIHGNPEQLQGVVLNAPMVIGGHEFPHHLFISHQKMDRQHLILGQPFLSWFCARLQYHRSGLVKMFLWREPEEGKRPTISINLTKPNDSRNKSTIACPHHGTPQKKKVHFSEYDQSQQFYSSEYDQEHRFQEEKDFC